MSKALMFALLLAGAPVAAYADDAVNNGAASGAAAGGAVGGAVVGAPLGAAAGIVGGIAGALTPKFHHYVVEERVPCFAWVGRPHVVVGDVLPAEGVVLYPVPSEYGVTEYRYTVVDDTPVLVDPRTRRVAQVIE